MEPCSFRQDMEDFGLHSVLLLLFHSCLLCPEPGPPLLLFGSPHSCWGRKLEASPGAMCLTLNLSRVSCSSFSHLAVTWLLCCDRAGSLWGE